MIDSERLAGGIAQLDPRNRELLAYSLGKRVPDQHLARLYQCAPHEIPPRRAHAIEGLAALVGVERSSDMGELLQALLEPATWEENFFASSGQPPSESPPAPAAVEPVEREALAPQPIGPEPGMGPPPPTAPEPPARRAGVTRRAGLWAAGTVAALGLVAGAALFGASRSSKSTPPRPREPQTRPFIPESAGRLAYPFPSVPASAPCHPTATVRGRTTLYRRPGGRPRVRIAARTEWGSPRVLGVARRRGRWLGVQVPELGNHKLGWLPIRRADLGCVRWSMYVDLSRRRLVVRHDGDPLHSFVVAIGSPDHPTPRGRYSVTDKLRVNDPASPYGCCILALTGHQNRLPTDWPGGDRLAVHAAKDPSSIGHAVSLGCMRVGSAQARWLLRAIPLGTPIYIRA